MKKRICMLLVMVMCLTSIMVMQGGAVSEVSAAVNWPGLSSSAYCEYTATKAINVYRDTALKTRGTSSPAKSYSAYIAKNDVCRIYKITSSYTQINYPTSNGRRTGYVSTKTLFNGKTAPAEVVTAKGKATTYVAPKGKTYGNTAKGDKVYACGTSSGYTAVIYTAKSGSRAYKYGWVTTNNYNGTIKGSAASQGTVTTKKSLADVARKEIGYQGTKKNGTGKGDYTKYGKWIGSNGTQWCASFVSWCANRAGISTKIVPKTPDCDRMESDSTRYRKWSKSALQSIRKNDVIFFAPSSKPSDATHVGIVTSVNVSKKTITLIEGNTGSYYGPDIVKEITYTVNSNTGKITKGYNGFCFCGYIAVN